MEKKKSKGFWRSLLVLKSHSNCCNIQFEEVVKDNSLEEKKVDSIESNKTEAKEVLDINKQKPSCSCGHT